MCFRSVIQWLLSLAFLSDDKHALIQEGVLLIQKKHINPQDILFPKEIKLVKK